VGAVTHGAAERVLGRRLEKTEDDDSFIRNKGSRDSAMRIASYNWWDRYSSTSIALKQLKSLPEIASRHEKHSSAQLPFDRKRVWDSGL
jgi:hypothetical protein